MAAEYFFTQKGSNHTKVQRHKELQKRYFAINLCAFVSLCEKTDMFFTGRRRLFNP